MSIIHDYIGSFDAKEHKCTKFINRCAKISELQTYLDNLDAKARLEQTSSNIINLPAIEMIEKQNKRLMAIIKQKINLALDNSNINDYTLRVFTTRVNSALGNDIDMVSMHPNQTTQAYKTYLVTNIILNNLNNRQEQALAK